MKGAEPEHIIKVCLRCKSAYRGEIRGCQTCGIELVDECPSCKEPFEGIDIRRTVEYCPNCLKKMMEATQELVVEIIPPDPSQEETAAGLSLSKPPPEQED